MILDSPRQYIRTDEYFGPDRRRRADPAYNGPERRRSAEDVESEKPKTDDETKEA